MPVGTVFSPARFARALDDVRRRRGGEIDLDDRPVEKCVAHRTADDARLLAVSVEQSQHATERLAFQQCASRIVVEREGHSKCPGTRTPFSICEGMYFPLWRRREEAARQQRHDDDPQSGDDEPGGVLAPRRPCQRIATGDDEEDGVGGERQEKQQQFLNDRPSHDG